MKQITRRSLLAAAPATIGLAAWPALAAPQYDVGATDTEIKIGNIMPYSGPASAYGGRQDRGSLFRDDQ
jgi:branched-chain amino acid transport system substrate-binding protein